MGKKYGVHLAESERAQLFELISSGVAPARQIMRARVLLKADESLGTGWVDWQICTALDIAPNTVARIRQQFVQEGLESTLRRKPPQRDYPRRLQGEEEAHLIALACSAPPDGHQRWTLRLLAQRMVELGYVDQVSHETVRQVLKKRTQTLAETRVVYSA